ncbi:MAG: transcription initiation factor IIB [Hadesarchaea archaeon]|nr:transcription initiation factor IIB [Hadesarchaea archaeon]
MSDEANKNHIKVIKMAEAKDKTKKQTASEKPSCPKCGSTNFVKDHEKATIVCGNCGRIIKEDIKDMGPEWRAFDQEQRENRSRAGPPMTETIHDKGLSTQIDWKNRDAKGSSLSPKKRSQVYRLRKWQKRIRVSGAKDRNLATAFSEIDRMSSQLGLPQSVRETASRFYRKASEEDLVRGRSIEGVSAAILYMTCRMNQIPRTLEEITGISSVDKKEIARTYRYVARELGVNLPPTDPVKYVARFGSSLEVSGETRAKAVDLIRDATDKGLTTGKSPVGTAGAALYIAGIMTGEKRAQREVAEVTGTTEVTIRNRYQDLVEGLNLEVEI